VLAVLLKGFVMMGMFSLLFSQLALPVVSAPPAFEPLTQPGPHERLPTRREVAEEHPVDQELRGRLGGTFRGELADLVQRRVEPAGGGVTTGGCGGTVFGFGVASDSDSGSG